MINGDIADERDKLKYLNTNCCYTIDNYIHIKKYFKHINIMQLFNL